MNPDMDSEKNCPTHDTAFKQNQSEVIVQIAQYVSKYTQKSRDAPDIRPLLRSGTGIWPDIGTRFGGRISGLIPDTSNTRISGQSFYHYSTIQIY
jgi:hypothetical protein